MPRRIELSSAPLDPNGPSAFAAAFTGPYSVGLTLGISVLIPIVLVAIVLRVRRKRRRPVAPLSDTVPVPPARPVYTPPPESDAIFRLLFEHHPAPAWVFDEDSLRFVAVNDAVLRRYGYTRDRFLALKIRDVCPDEDADRLIGAPCGPLQWRHRISSGALIAIEVTSHRITSDGRLLRLVVASDAIDRRKAEGALKERDDLLHDVLTNVPCAVSWKDRASIYIGCNDQAARDHGLTVPGEVIGQTDYDLARVSEEAESVRASDLRVIESEEPLLDVEETRTLTDGTKVTFLTNRVPLRDSAGRVVGVVGVAQNVTERKRLEDELRHSQKMEAVGRLAGGVAHDFNNLLTIVTGSVHLIRSLPPGDTSLGSYVDEIQGAVDRATALTRQLLAFSRKQPSRPEVLDLNDIVTGLVSLLRRLLGNRVTIRTDLATEPVRVRADRGHLEQILMNLAVNARDAMPSGGALTIATAPDIANQFARLTVSDTGTGMSDEVKAKIFEPFFTTKEIGKGTGLGLATVHGIVQQAGGGIEVTSTLGTGTTFAIRLPWCSTPPPPPSGTLTPLAPLSARPGRSVLLVEDEERVRKLVRGTLEGWGYAVTEADRAEEALGLLAVSREFDLLVTDLVMPGMDGRELAARVRAERPGTAIVFISGYVPDLKRLDGFSDGVFLPKPFTPFDLLRCAERALRQRKASEAHAHTAVPVPVPGSPVGAQEL
ncbi:Blue-light-activated protein [Gemmata sp. SH-PL17]|uniref:hybrid sensor histidine kinase/response regulator n=1 Tax=Gemmata sp. SH-PL17 TaxID=1630693 RepID=UPI00078CA9EC|nr:PAS domain-containing sensor histidine kinase [Gemmata sp. SH-PL17]AMV25647.1 Blue-light-activated protein [Gemmata sp. SH-PL17]